MYSILSWGSFCFKPASIRRGMEVISLWHCWSPGFFHSGLQLICIFLVSCFSFSSWQYPIDSLWGSGFVSLRTSQAHQHHGHLTNFWCFWQCGQVPNLNLTLDLKQLGLWAVLPFLRTLGPWFPNEIQNLFSSEKRTLDHWVTVQFFSLAQVRRLWWQL